MKDAQITALASTAITAASAQTLTGTSISIPTGTPRSGFKFQFIIKNITASVAGANTVQPVLQRSTDNTNWTNTVIGDIRQLTTGVTENTVQVLTIETEADFIRPAVIITPTSTGNIIANYEAYLVPTKPV